MVTRAADLRPDTRPVDADVKVPAAVARAAAAAEAAQRAAYPENNPEPPPAPQPQPDNTITIAEPPAPQPIPGTVTSLGNEPPPAPQPPTPQPPAPKTPIADAGPGDTFEQRYKAEYGRHMKLKDIVAQLTPRIEMLENRVVELTEENVRLRAQPPENPQPAPQPVPEITEKDREEFGPEMIALMERIAKSTINPHLSGLQQLQQTTSTLSDRLQGTVQQQARSAQQAMMASLDAQMPEWRKVNLMPEFKAWLALRDRYSGAIRQKMLLDAWEQNDTPRVFEFFKGFVSELAATAPAEDDPPAPAPAPQPPKPGLESLAAPGRARQQAGAPPSPSEKQIITTADIKAFYADVRAGKYRGREQEQQQLEQELFLAQREGRVRQV